MPFDVFHHQVFHYLLKRKTNQFFVSVAIRKLALGMVLVFEPIYIYLHFNKSIPLALLYFGAIFGLHGLLVVYGGKFMDRVGLKNTMFCSHFFYFAYYLCLFSFGTSFLLIPLAIVLRSLGRVLFWPAFHTDFTRFSAKGRRGKEVGKLNIASFGPIIVAPALGGMILGAFGYQVLFLVILAVLLASVVPLLFSKEVHEVYTDSYERAWERIFRKGNRKTSLSFAAYTMESGIARFVWPLFMFSLAIEYSAIGEISSFGLLVSMIFSLYLGRIADSLRRSKLLNIGAGLTSIAWIAKMFVKGAFSAVLARSLYRIFRTAAYVPYKALFYDKAELKGPKADEFIIYREIVGNLSRFFLFIILAGVFVFTTNLKLAFVLGAIFGLGFMFLGRPPQFDMAHLWNSKKSKIS